MGSVAVRRLDVAAGFRSPSPVDVTCWVWVGVLLDVTSGETFALPFRWPAPRE